MIVVPLDWPFSPEPTFLMWDFWETQVEILSRANSNPFLMSRRTTRSTAKRSTRSSKVDDDAMVLDPPESQTESLSSKSSTQRKGASSRGLQMLAMARVGEDLSSPKKNKTETFPS